MFKKIFKSLILLSLPLLLTSCGKKMSTEEIFETSVSNFANVSDYTLNMSMGMKLSTQGADIMSLKTTPTYKVDNVSNTVLKNDNTSFYFLFFGDDSTDIVYEDFNNSVKYSQSTDSGEIIKESISSKSNPSYVLNVFLRNGVLVNGEYSEYSMNDTDFYVLPLTMNYDTMATFFASLDTQSMQDSLGGGTLVDTSAITDEQKELLKDAYINFNYLVYKDSLLPALIEVDSNSIIEFSQKVSEAVKTSENLDMALGDGGEISFNLDTISISLGNYMTGETVIIPDNIISNAIEKEEDEDFYDFSIEDNTEDEIIDEVIEEEPVIDEEPSFNYKELVSDVFTFSINDSDKVELPLKAKDLEEYGFIVEIPEENILDSNKYSVPIKVSNEKGDSFYITVMNDLDDSIDIIDGNIIRVEFDSLDINNSLLVSEDISFDSDIRDLSFDFDDESFKYEGDLSSIYTYQYDESKYIDFQIDNETGKICFISMTYM